MSKTYRDWDPDQAYLLPPSPADWLPEDDLVYFVLDTVRDLDLRAITRKYENGDGRGFPPYHPRMMITLLLYSYTQGVFSSRRIMKRCERDAAYRVIVHDDAPNFRTISDFRKLHLAELEALFVQVLRLCQKAGLVKLGHVSLDGTKVKANASRHKAMSYGRMKEEEKRLRAEIRDLLNRAAATDAEEDERYGGDRRGDELPKELSRRRGRLEKIREARKALENEAKAAAEAERKRREEEDRKRGGGSGPGRRRTAVKEVPDDKKQYNFTDPETSIMKSNNKGFDQCGNAQAVVDREHQVVVAADVTNEPNDKKQLRPMVRQAKQNVGRGRRIDKLSADSGYFSEDNVTWLEQQGIDGYIATGRLKHHEQVPPHPRGRPPRGQTVKERMARKLHTKKGRETYAERKWITEPVFGQIKRGLGFRQFLLNGIVKMRSEWRLVCMANNLRKLWAAA
jgi:transposase/NAD(P)-dependent dehydrogenase (short-subunit alcohol dehydrogenase family)